VAVNEHQGLYRNAADALINEALMRDGREPRRSRDAVMKWEKHPLGPLELADFIGLDVCVDIMHVTAGRVGGGFFFERSFVFFGLAGD